MRNFSVIKDRMLEYLENKGFSKYDCYKNTGISNGVFSQKNGMSEENILRFLNYYKDISTEWLLTGKGNMLRDAQPTTPTPSLPATPSSLRDLPAISPCPELLSQVAELKATIADLKQDKAHLQDTIKHQQEQISFFLQHNKELEEVLSDYKEVIEDYQKKATQKG